MDIVLTFLVEHKYTLICGFKLFYTLFVILRPTPMSAIFAIKYKLTSEKQKRIFLN